MKLEYSERRRVGWTALAVMLSVSAVAAADLATAAAQAVKRGGTLVLARPEEPLSWNPYTQGDKARSMPSNRSATR
jgi:hypothetical protein